MQCTECRTGELRRTPILFRDATLVVCENPACFHVFALREGVRSGTVLTPHARWTQNMASEFAEPAERTAAIASLPRA